MGCKWDSVLFAKKVFCEKRIIRIAFVIVEAKVSKAVATEIKLEKMMDFAKEAKKHHAAWAMLGAEQQGEWQGKGPYSHILRRDLFESGEGGVEHVFGEVAPHLQNDLGTRFHMYAHHLTSSQIMTYNFFRYFLLDREKENSLLGALAATADIHALISDRVWFGEFEKDGFEQTSHPTNFDFYLATVGGKRLFFEVKYTEKEFGLATCDTYRIYQPEFPQTLNFKTDPPAPELFLKNYQIYRNIWHCRSEHDYVFFIYPEKNEDLSMQLDDALSPGLKNIFSITWETLVQAVEPSDPAYFGKFRSRYLF